MCQPRDWNAGAFRKILHGEPTPFVPSSLFHRYQTPEEKRQRTQGDAEQP